MKVRFLESAAIGGWEIYKKGQEVDLPDDQAQRQIDSGAAIALEQVRTATDKTKTRKAIQDNG